MNIDDLRNDAKIKRQACVAFATDGLNNIFAINGAPEDRSSKIAKEACKRIKDLLGKGTKRATVSHSFTKFPCIHSYNRAMTISLFEDFVYTILNAENCVCLRIDNRNIKKIRYRKSLLGSYDPRIFACCERKILGYMIDNGIDVSKYDFYIKLNPCLLCLPLLKKGHYFDRYNKQVESFHVQEKVLAKYTRYIISNDTSNIVLLGNGFDLAHGIPSSYRDFYKYLVYECKDDGSVLTLNSMYPSNKKNSLWKNFEECLAFPDMNFLSELEDPLDEYLNPKFINKIIEDKFYEWLRTLPYYGGPVADSSFIKYLDNKNYFISFNYSDSLKRIYDFNHVCNIHGCAVEGKEEKLVYGHKHIDTDNEFILTTEKPVKEVITKHLDELKMFSKKTNGKIVVIGFSYSDVDFPYLQKLKELNEEKDWVFYYHTESDLSSLEKCLVELNLDKNKYSIRIC